MNIQDLRDIVAQINAAHPTENSEFPILLEGKDGFLVITFMTHDDIKIQLRHWRDYDENWTAIAPFYQLSDIAWHSQKHPDDMAITIIPIDGELHIESELYCDRFGDTLEWLEELPFYVLSLVLNFYPFVVKWRNPWDRVVWKAEERLEALEFLFLDEDEFEWYYECSVEGHEWFHLQAAAFIARQNTVRKRAKYPALSGVNVSAVNNNLEVSAMCPTATTYRLIWRPDPYWAEFSFTVPVELLDQISGTIDASTIDSVTFSVNPDLIQVKVDYGRRVNEEYRETGTVYLYAAPIKGRYFYPKVPVNQVTERSVAVSCVLLKEAIASATQGSRDLQCNEVLLQVQDEQLFVHGLASSSQIDAADCTGITDNQIRVCSVKLLDILKYVPDHTTLFLDFPDKVTQALMVGTTQGIQYLVFGLVKGDRILGPELDIEQQLLAIPGLIPGEPDLVLQLAEQPILDPPMSEAEELILKSKLINHYGLMEDWDYCAAIDETCDRLIEARSIVEKYQPTSETQELLRSLKETLDDYEYYLAEYESGDTGELYCHGGLLGGDLEIEIEAINDVATSIKLISGRLTEASLKIEKTYSVRMTFA